jgi:hypothetical protein
VTETQASPETRRAVARVGLRFASVAGALVGVVLALAGCRADPEAAVTDAEALREWQLVMEEPLAFLNTTPELEGLEAAGPAELGECAADPSGGTVSDISAGRDWTNIDDATDGQTSENYDALAQLMAYFRDDGWRLIDATNELTRAAPPGAPIDTAIFSKRFGPQQVKALIQAFTFGVAVELWFRDAPRVCSMAPPPT